MDFCYIAQALKIDSEACNKIQMGLSMFHKYKESIIKAGGRRGEKNNIITHWYIPKLEFMQSIVPDILANGAAIQWSANVMEHAHITEVKDPADTMNNQNYESQICHYLDQEDKCHRFDLVTAIRNAGLNFHSIAINKDYNSDREDQTSSLLKCINPVSCLAGVACKVVDYFNKVSHLQQGLGPDDTPIPFHSFVELQVAFHLNCDPSFKHSTVDDVAAKFKILGLRHALAENIVQV